METHYLLLRNNKQSGPYSIDELIGQQLKPTDLIWTEGKSQAWLHPYEMDEFTPTFTKSVASTTPITNQSTTHTSTTDRVNFDTPQYSTSDPASSLKTQTVSSSNYSKKQEYIEEEPIRFVFHKKKPSVNYGYVFGTMVALALLFMGWQRGWLPVNHTSSSESVIVPLISSESHTAKASQHIVHTTPVIKQEETPVTYSDAPVQTAEMTTVVNTPVSPVIKQKRTTKKAAKPIIAPPVIKQETITPDLIPAQQDDASLKTNPVPIAETANTSTEAKPDASEKKKGFGLFRGLFHKRKKDVD